MSKSKSNNSKVGVQKPSDEVSMFKTMRAKMTALPSHFSCVECAGTDNNNYLKKVKSILLSDKSWKNTSQHKSAEPTPDFVNDKQKMMLEMIKVDDNSPESGFMQKIDRNLRTGKPNMSLHKNVKDVQNSSISEVEVNIPVSDILQKASLKYYRSNIKTRLQKHTGKVAEKYKKNRQSYKLIFFIQDYSSWYVRYFPAKDGIKRDYYNPLLDSEFINMMRNNGVDFVLWHKPHYGNNEIPEYVLKDLQNVRSESLIDFSQEGLKNYRYAPHELNVLLVKVDN